MRRFAVNRKALRIAAIYLAFGFIWIAVSDSMVEALFGHSAQMLSLAQTYKGWLFIIVTSILVYLLCAYFIGREERARSELVSSEQHFRHLATFAPVGIYHADADGALTYVNPCFAEMFGLSSAHCLGDDWEHGVHEEDRERIYERWKQCVGSRGRFHDEYRCRHADGTIVWVREEGEPQFDAAGNLAGYLGVIIDITEQKMAEQALNDLASRLQLAVTTANVGFWDWDLRTNKVYYSPEWKRQIGYEDHEIADDYEEWQSRVHPENLGPALEQIQNCRQGLANNYCAEFRFQHKDGSWRWIRAQADIQRDEHGQVARMYGTHLDITPIKQAYEEMIQSEARLNHLMTANPTVLYQHKLENGEHVPMWISDSVTRILGYTVEEALQPDWWPAHLHPDDRARCLELSKGLLLCSQHVMEYRFLHKTGHVLWIRDELRVLCDKNGEASEMIGVWNDITEQRRQEEQMRLYAAAFENTGEGVMITDLEKKIVAVNHAFEEITGYRRDEVLQQTPALLHSGRHERSFYYDLWTAVEKTGGWRGEIWDRRKNGEIYPSWFNINTILDAQGKPAYHVAVFSDISQRKQTEQELEHLAHYDALTDLPNRVLLQLRMSHGIKQAQRHGGRLAVLFIDLNDFKKVNDSLGHTVGDELLKAVAARLRQRVREEDTLARFGGDEFLLLLENIRTTDDVSKVACDLLASLAEPFQLSGGHELFVEGNIGISLFPDDGTVEDALLRAADAAMYKAKETGRNNFCFSTAEISAAAIENLELETALRGAAERRELLLHYQPKLDIQTGRLSGAEALIRWQRPGIGLVPPMKFIPVAERSGLIIAIGDWVIRHACERMAAWRDQGVTFRQTAVNVSTHQFRSGNFINSIESALKDHDIKPGTLELEITESALLEKPEEAIGVLQALNGLGVSLALDDFGTGYSNLSFLGRFPIDVLKIDMSFVRGIGVEKNAEKIVDAIIDLAQGLGMRTIAEGIETKEQLDYLRLRGCNEIQGYYLSRPVPEREFEKFIGKGSYDVLDRTQV